MHESFSFILTKIACTYIQPIICKILQAKISTHVYLYILYGFVIYITFTNNGQQE
uniref:Uncharacterized protein n=1 Tax=Glycine max TaxID=3847 RepID=C6TIM1_SOYBN|nr:unknown [Glycine max]